MRHKDMDGKKIFTLSFEKVNVKVESRLCFKRLRYIGLLHERYNEHCNSVKGGIVSPAVQ